jgi:hypothetical protein
MRAVFILLQRKNLRRAPRPHGSALCLWVSATQSRVFQVLLQPVRAAPAPAPTKAKAHANRHSISGPCRFSRERGETCGTCTAIRRLWLARQGPQAGTMAALVAPSGSEPAKRGAAGSPAAAGGRARATEGDITVGAVDSNDARASYRNYGSCVSIFTPGTMI